MFVQLFLTIYFQRAYERLIFTPQASGIFLGPNLGYCLFFTIGAEVDRPAIKNSPDLRILSSPRTVQKFIAA